MHFEDRWGGKELPARFGISVGCRFPAFGPSHLSRAEMCADTDVDGWHSGAEEVECQDCAVDGERAEGEEGR